MKSKYRNKKITVDGITFDSLKEANRWKELKLMERAGEITDLRRQVKFKLIPTIREPVNQMGSQGVFKKGKVVERECSYVADFVYKNKLGFEVVEDVKGYKDSAAYALFVVKRKMMLYLLGIRVKEI